MGKLIPEYLDPRAYTIVQGGVTETTALLSKSFMLPHKIHGDTNISFS